VIIDMRDSIHLSRLPFNASVCESLSYILYPNHARLFRNETEMGATGCASVFECASIASNPPIISTTVQTASLPDVAPRPVAPNRAFRQCHTAEAIRSQPAGTRPTPSNGGGVPLLWHPIFLGDRAKLVGGDVLTGLAGLDGRGGHPTADSSAAKA
jgi:hypothetical protein